MTVVIPIFNELAHYRQEISLDLKSYLCDISWNHRQLQWYLSLFKPDETPIICGLALVLNYNILDQFRPDQNLPQGDLYCIDTTKKEIGITRENFGKTVELVYVGVDEL